MWILRNGVITLLNVPINFNSWDRKLVHTRGPALFACEISRLWQILPTLETVFICVVRKGFWWQGGSHCFCPASSNWMNYPSWWEGHRSLPWYVPETHSLKQLPGPQWAKSSFRIEHGWDFRNPVIQSVRLAQEKGQTAVEKEYKGGGNHREN